MSYESKCIRDIVLDDINRIMFLPDIQREYVWKPDAIEKLFDSIMGEYPIGSFLFWKIREDKNKDWNSYEFVRDYDEDDPHNNVANLSGINKDIYLILDGQQRLTSLYIGLRGSYRYFHYKWRKTKLYFNLLKPPIKGEDNPEELTYQFAFKEPSTVIPTDKEFWYPVGKILDFEDSEDAKEAVEKEIVSYDDKLKSSGRKLIGQLHNRIHTQKLINYYEEKSDDYDKVVEVFIRANTGGKKLDYSDILLSTATAKWKNLNAREEIHTFTDEINKIGSGYEFGKDFVLKGCLYLTETLPIQYKVKNFTRKNLEEIEQNWDNIKANISSTIELVNQFGFTQKNITSAGALLPIAFYLLKHNNHNFVSSTHKDDVNNQNIIQKWLTLSLLKNTFGGASDTTLKNIRDEILLQTSFKIFPIEDLNNKLGIEAGFPEAQLDNLLTVNYKTAYSFLILSLLYPDRDWKDLQLHEDHIFPKTAFTPAKLKARGYDEQKIKSYMQYYNTIVNLELLTNTENLEKHAKDFDDWIKSRDTHFRDRHTIPEMFSYGFDDFLNFVEKRKVKIKEKLKVIVR